MALGLCVNKQSHEQGKEGIVGGAKSSGKVPVPGFKFCNLARFPVSLSQAIKMVSVGHTDIFRTRFLHSNRISL